MAVTQQPRVLTVAGSDSGGGAGIQADLKTFTMLGTFGTSALTALTSQNTHGVQGIFPVTPEFVEQQMDSVLGDLGTSAIKTGMLPTAPIIRSVAAKIVQYNVGLVVVDPVMVATSGDTLAGGTDVLCALRDVLIPHATIVTPNLHEACMLLGKNPEDSPINSVSDMRDLARQLHEISRPRFVYLKGGHLTGPVREQHGALDILYDGNTFTELTGPWQETSNTHGTGCTLASALAAYLAKGLAVPDAAQSAKDYLARLLAHSNGLSLGTGIQRPLDHSFALSKVNGTDRYSLTKALRIYGVTDPKLDKKLNRDTEVSALEAIKGGATIVQIREKNAETGEFCAKAERILRVGRQNGVPIIVNDRADVALAVGADGLHVGQDDMQAHVARRLIGPHMILGVSVKTVEQAVKAYADGADYLGAGAIYPTPTKPESEAIGISVLRDICASVPIPVVAIGGISNDNAREILEAGAVGVAVVSAMFDYEDVASATRELVNVVDGK
eukprot:comp24325_c5_seq1/m.45920 comp24325_c5_seq1/g.45920  ORF comp24325_c5_seq1/g.45920 comp24325_c5_seq1/m.45920 type:complete len:500 (-) comp24325_c5_seq1:50-1549(-)